LKGEIRDQTGHLRKEAPAFLYIYQDEVSSEKLTQDSRVKCAGKTGGNNTTEEDDRFPSIIVNRLRGRRRGWEDCVVREID